MGALYLFKEKENGFYQIHCFFGRAIVYYLAENIFFYNCFYHLCFLETFVLISAFCLICTGHYVPQLLTYSKSLKTAH